MSVITPCFQQGHFLAEAVQSVLDQTMSHLECIVVNDGSPDRTREIAARFARRDPRVQYVEQPNRGVGAARNCGLGKARGQFIQFLDADDILAPEKLRLQVDALCGQERWAIAYSDYRFCPRDDTSQTIPATEKVRPRFVMQRPLWDMASRWETQLSIPIHCFLFDASLFREGRIAFDESLATHEDWDCWMRILALDPIVLHTPGELAVYRRHSQSMTNNRPLMWRGFARAIRNQRRRLIHDPVLQELLLEKLVEIAGIYQEDRQEAGNAAARRAVGALRRILPWPLQIWTRRLTVLAYLSLGIDVVW